MSVVYKESAGLAVGHKVVWISDGGPEVGVVKWIGVLPDARQDDVTVGVEFENPVGTGSGKYKHKWLFRAKHGHASLLPILGLMKYEEFYGTQTDTDQDKNNRLTVPSAPSEPEQTDTYCPQNTNARVRVLEDQVLLQQQQLADLQRQLQRARQGPPTTMTTPTSLNTAPPPSYEQCMSDKLRDEKMKVNVAIRPRETNL